MTSLQVGGVGVTATATVFVWQTRVLAVSPLCGTMFYACKVCAISGSFTLCTITLLPPETHNSTDYSRPKA